MGRTLRPCATPRCPVLVKSGHCTAHQRQREKRYDDQRRNDPAREAYRSPRWKAERKAFLAANPWCLRCAREGRRTRATVVHHDPPHRGDMVRFWDQRTWRPACKPCHDGPIQSEERRVGTGGAEWGASAPQECGKVGRVGGAESFRHPPRRPAPASDFSAYESGGPSWRYA